MDNIKVIAYKAVDVLTLGRGISRNFHGARIRFPPRWSRYFAGDYEPETFQFLRENLKPGDTFLDIGAHIGLFSVVASRLVGKKGRVISFEPTPYTRGVMRDVLRLNGVTDGVEVRSEAVSSESGTTTFFDSGETISVVNSLVRHKDARAEFEVTVVTLDEFAAEHGVKPDCMKIDVEGSELELLFGAKKTLTADRPKIILSIHPPFVPNGRTTVEGIWSKLEEHCYNIFFEGQPVEREWFCSKPELFDVVLLPA